MLHEGHPCRQVGIHAWLRLAFSHQPISLAQLDDIQLEFVGQLFPLALTLQQFEAPYRLMPLAFAKELIGSQELDTDRAGRRGAVIFAYGF